MTQSDHALAALEIDALTEPDDKIGGQRLAGRN